MTVQTAELIVHSSNRTLTDSNKTTVNDYTWEIGKTLKNVIAIEVLYAEIPNSYYNLPSGSNTVPDHCWWCCIHYGDSTWELQQHQHCHHHEHCS